MVNFFNVKPSRAITERRTITHFTVNKQKMYDISRKCKNKCLLNLRTCFIITISIPFWCFSKIITFQAFAKG